MRIAEGTIGRVFVISLEDGDRLPECVENLARDKGVKTGMAFLVGGIGGGEIVTGPRDSAARPPEPIKRRIDGAHEISAVGVLASDESGKPVLHIHGAFGRGGETACGCLRTGVSTWLTGEMVLVEILGAPVVRAFDQNAGIAMLRSALAYSQPQSPAQQPQPAPQAVVATATATPAGPRSTVIRLFNAQLS